MKSKNCLYCSYVTNDKSNYKKHIKRMHSVDSLRKTAKLIKIDNQDHSNNDDDLYKKHDIRLKENFKLFVSRPSRCGKTVFVAKLIENLHSFAKQPPNLS